MNKVRRGVLIGLREKLEILKDELECVMAEEDEYRESMPENLQESERYFSSEEASDNIQAALDSLEEAMDSIDEAVI